ncbi:MAG: HAMP domain-containing protein [Deltaproteobacteria bacterium]|nr:HAMP domain-containing protein [Deltaproteobacteria bacterium]
MRLRSITTRMVLSTTLLVALVTITFSIVFLYQVKEALINDFTSQGESLTANLALNAELGLLLEDLDTLAALCDNLLKEETVEQIRVKDHEGKTVVDVRKENGGKSQQSKFSAKVVLPRPEDELSVFIGAEKNGKFPVLGEVEVFFSQKKLLGIITTIKWRIYLLAFLGLVGGGIIAYYLSWIMLKPIKRLVNASKAIAEGNWLMRVEEAGDDEIGQLIHDFNRMAASLEKKRNELEESCQQLARQERMAEIGKFSAMIAHEMKNPLGIIRGAINILAKRGVNRETKETMVTYINEEVTRLNQLAEDFLVFARPHSPQKEKIPPPDMFAKLKALSESRDDRGKGIAVRIESDDAIDHIYGDKNQVFQAVLNLLVNGIQASPAGGEVVVAVRNEERGTMVSVSDSGPGIRPEDRQKIFEPFYTRKEKGTGLGLAIVKKIVEMHNGTITVGNSKSGGACFELWLPQCPAFPSREGEAATGGGAASNRGRLFTHSGNN